MDNAKPHSSIENDTALDTKAATAHRHWIFRGMTPLRESDALKADLHREAQNERQHKRQRRQTASTAQAPAHRLNRENEEVNDQRQDQAVKNEDAARSRLHRPIQRAEAGKCWKKRAGRHQKQKQRRLQHHEDGFLEHREQFPSAVRVG